MKIDTQVDLYTLKRRLDALESRLYGAIDDVDGPMPLFGVYSHLICDGVLPTADSAALLAACSMFLTPRKLLDLSRSTGDMFPWRPFLLALDVLDQQGFEVGHAREWLESSIQDFMRAQGLEMLSIADVLSSPTGPLHELRRFVLSER